jgi:shikimate dehydrogenase
VGLPVAHSLSPAIHNLLFARHGLDRAYVALPCPPKALPLLLRALRAVGFGGVNATTPHKEAFARHAAARAPEVRVLGAANTLVPTRRGWRALSTDGRGFADWLEQEAGVELRGRDVTVLGAGAAARAVVWELLRRRPGLVTVINRGAGRLREAFFDVVRARGVVTVAMDEEPEAARAAAARAGVLVNATSWGLGGRSERGAPWDLRRVRTPVAVDLNYGPVAGATAFLDLARACARRYDGRGMLRWQAALAFAAWTGVVPDAADHRALARCLANLDRARAPLYTRTWQGGS